MSVSRDRLTFFGVLIAVGVAVFGYVRLGNLYPTTGRTDASTDHPARAADGGEEGAEEEAGHSEDAGSMGLAESDREE